MIWRAVSHLIPSVQAVTIGAQEAKVALVRSPVAKAVVPDGRPPLVPKFLGWIDVVNVENSVVALPTADTGTAQFGNKGKLTRPIARALVFSETVFVPMIFSALLGTKAMLAFIATAFTTLFSLPPRFKVTVPAAIFSSAVFNAILVSFKRCGAVAANDCYRCLFHALNILCISAKVKFDIACKRIEDAQRQGDMFIEQPKSAKPEQTDIFGDAA